MDKLDIVLDLVLIILFCVTIFSHMYFNVFLFENENGNKSIVISEEPTTDNINSYIVNNNNRSVIMEANCKNQSGTENYLIKLESKFDNLNSEGYVSQYNDKLYYDQIYNCIRTTENHTLYNVIHKINIPLL